jgi:LuxR family maltose regulon positive regulatory protein
VERLQRGLAGKLILVSAPAGYGKTTLICEWLATCRGSVAWVSLDRGDNDPNRFWAYLLAALQSALSSSGQTLPEIVLQNNPSTSEALISSLINELDKFQQPIILVLDDYHDIEAQAIHDGLSLLTEQAPAHFHLVILTRADPPLPLARLRARSQMVELRLADLRFTKQEAAELLRTVMKLDLSDTDLSTLEASTEGWVAGLQMAGLSLQGREDVSTFIRSFSGENRYILDFLFEEVFQRQPEEIQDFLLRTAVLDELCESLCNALTVRNDGQAMLGLLERSNLFLIPLDDRRKWYRYHSLFADLLRGYLHHKSPEKITDLHARASLWFEKQGLTANAIHHALLAGDWERVVGLISANVFALLEQNELNVVAGRLESLAPEKCLQRAWLLVGRAWLATYTGKLSAVDSLLKLLEAELNGMQGGEDQQTLLGHCAAIRTFVSWVKGQRDLAVQTARLALGQLPATDYVTRCLTATVLGLTLTDPDARWEAYEQALTYSRLSAVSHITFFTHGCWAYELVLQGRLSEALEFAQRSLRLAQANQMLQPLPTLSYLHATIGMILWQRNQLESSLVHTREAVALALRWGQVDALHFAYTMLGDTLFAMGAVEEAFAVLQQSRQVAEHTSKWFNEITISQEVEWYLSRSNLEAALQCLHTARINSENGAERHFSSLINLSIAQVFMAQGQFDKSLAELAYLLEELASRKNKYHSVMALAWQALAYFRLGEKSEAFASLEQALTLAGEEIYVRHFITPGETLIQLLQEARKAGIHPKYIDRVLDSLQSGAATESARIHPESPMIEPLSAREMQVLRLLAEGCADKQIAENLVIAPGTVHKHLKSIYSKLGVHSRTAAIACARELGVV